MYFETHTSILMGDTTCTGYVNPDWYIANQGHQRELALCRHVLSALSDMGKGDVPITRDAFVDIHRAVALFEPITCRLAFGSARQSSIKLWYEFCDANHALVASGGQTIAFANANHRLIRIPSLWRQFAEKFSADSEPAALSRGEQVFAFPSVVPDSPSFSTEYRAVLADSNAVGNVYFARLAALVSAARDAFVHCQLGRSYSWTTPPHMFIEEIAIRYLKDFYVGDPIRCQLRLDASVSGRLTMYVELVHGETGACHARASQIMRFTDAAGGPIDVPFAWTDAARRYPVAATTDGGRET